MSFTSAYNIATILLTFCLLSFFTPWCSYLPLVTCLNLNPIENFFLRNRLERIQSQTTSIGISSHGGYKFLKLLENHDRDTKQDPEDDDGDDDLLLHDDDDSTKKQEQQVVISNLVLIFPGAGGPDSFTLELENNIRESLLQQEKNAFSRDDGDDEPTCIDTTTTATATCRRFIVETLDWTRFRGSIFSAAYDGEAFGEAIGQLILQQCQSCSSLNYGNGPQQQPQKAQQQQQQYPQYPQNIHLIGISVGAFAANACCSTLRCSLHHDNDHNQVLRTSSPYTRLTLLDPFTSRGIGGLGYGNANFGIDADYAEQYLNTDDPVPSTNEPLDLCATWDVTGAVEREEEFVLPENETMHCWPLVYFARYVCKKNAGRVLIHGQDGVPERGSVTFL